MKRAHVLVGSPAYSGGVAAAATLDRLLHRSVVTLDGASYRLRNHAASSNELRHATTGTNLTPRAGKR